MFAHPLTSFWTHLEASNCHIEKIKKIVVFLIDFSNSRIFQYFPVSTLVGGPCFDPWSDDDDLMKSCESDEELLGNCIAHTRAFSTWATEVDFQSTARAATTTRDGSGSAAWINRLQGMNIPIANHGNMVKWTLSDKLCSLAQQGRTFTLDWHQSGKYNYNACTSIICNCCRAKLVIWHPGLPSKGFEKADANLITDVNEQLVHFLFTEEEIAEHNLLEPKIFCTVERHWPGSVVAHPVTCPAASSL